MSGQYTATFAIYESTHGKDSLILSVPSATGYDHHGNYSALIKVPKALKSKFFFKTFYWFFESFAFITHILFFPPKINSCSPHLSIWQDLDSEQPWGNMFKKYGIKGLSPKSWRKVQSIDLRFS